MARAHHPVPVEQPVSAWAFVLAVFAASRIFYLVSGALLVGMMPTEPFHLKTSDTPFGTLSIWAHYDGDHYVSAALHGYSEGGGASPAFFPLYPISVRLLAELLGGPMSRGSISILAVAVSLIALPFALWFVYRVTENGWGKRAAQAAVLTLAFFPTSFFLNSAYTESLFLAFSAGAVWAIRLRRDLLLACLFAGLSTATRNVGIFLLIPLFLEYWRNRQSYGWQAAHLILASSGLAAYMAYLWWQFGNPLAFQSAQADWGREAVGPWDALTSAFDAALQSTRVLVESVQQVSNLNDVLLAISGTNPLYSMFFFLLALVVILYGLSFMPLELTVYALALFVLPSFFGTPENPLMGIPRYVLAAFPVFVVLGVLLQDRRLLLGVLIASAAMSLPLVALFVNWYFVA